MPTRKNSESSDTSLAPSSPSHAPYFVQSPSHNSHDVVSTTSFQSTPVSPSASPPHSSVGHHSRESSSTRFSGSGSRKISPNDSGSGVKQSVKTHKNWKGIEAIEEEGEYDESGRGFPRRCYFPAFVVGFFVLFSLFSLILWGASTPQKPKITMKSIKFERLTIQAGSDFTGVATDMVSMNATVKLNFHNIATFFGVHVTSTPFDLSYSQITIGSGSIQKFYQSRKTQRSVSVTIVGNKIPLYGSGTSLSVSSGTANEPVPLNLKFVVQSKAYVLGKLVKPRFSRKIECSLLFDPKKLNVVISLKNSCTYH